MSISVENITPVMAEKFLGSMRGNRPVSESRVIEYAIAMDSGAWSLNGETIKFDAEGRMFDGQHRCRGCVLAGKSFQSYVARGVIDPNAFATVDMGKARSHSDVLGAAGYQMSHDVGAAGSLIYLYQNSRLSVNGPTRPNHTRKSMSGDLSSKIKRMPLRSSHIPKGDLLAFVESIEERLLISVKFACAMKLSRLIPRSMVAALHYLFSQTSTIDTEKFFDDLANGVGLNDGDPVYTLRERLIANLGQKPKMSRWLMFALIIKAWNKRREGGRTKVLKMVDGEAYPVIG